jgi:hypothetical protein
MSTADLLVFLYRTIKEKEEELSVLDQHLQFNAQEAMIYRIKKETALEELDKLKGVIPVIKELHDNGGQDRDDYITTPSI